MVARSASPAGFTPAELPGAAVAADGTIAAIAEPSRVTLLEIADGAAFAEIGIDPDALASQAGWLGTPPRLLVLSRYDAYSTAHLLDPRGPRTIAEIRLESPMRLHATVGATGLVVGAHGAAMLLASDTHLIAYQFPSRTVPLAAGAAGTQFVVGLTGSIEEWDPQNRMPKRRLRLPRASVITGVGGSERLVWMTTQQDPARLDVIPLVNRGQPKAHELPEPIASVAGHPRSDFVACLGADTGRVYVIDLDGRSPARVVQPAAIDRVDAVALVIGRTAGVLLAQAGAPIEILPLDGRDAERGAASAAAAARSAPARTAVRDEARGDPASGGDEVQRDATGADELEGDEIGGDEVERDEVERDDARRDEVEGDEIADDEVERDDARRDEIERDDVERDEVERDAAAQVRFAGDLAANALPHDPRDPDESTDAAAPSEPWLARLDRPAQGAPPEPRWSTAADEGPRQARAAQATSPERRGVPLAPSENPPPPPTGGAAMFRPPGRPGALQRAAPVGGGAAPSASERFSAWRDLVRQDRPQDTAQTAREAGVAARGDAQQTWRDEVVAWSRAIAAGAVDHGVPAAPAIDAVIARFDLALALYPVLVLLYGAHLCGERGLAPVDVARMLDRQWDEALGRGELAERGVAEYIGSRVALSPVVLRVLDDLPPVTGVLVGEPGTVALLGPCVVVAGDEPLVSVAKRCIARIGGAILAAHGGVDRDALRFEARAHGAAPMLRAALDAAPDDAAIFVISDTELADRLGVPRLG